MDHESSQSSRAREIDESDRSSLGGADQVAGSSVTAWKVLLAACLSALTILVAVLTDGIVEWVVGAILVTVVIVVLDRRASHRVASLPRPVVIAMLLIVLALGVVQLTVAANDDRGTLLRPPISGGSDQIDFTAMAFTFYRYSVPGTSSGPEIADPVLDWAAEREQDGKLLQSWIRVGDRNSGPRAYSYRPHLYPVVLGSLFKIVGYHPEYGPGLNAVLYGLTCAALFAIGLRWVNLASAVATTALFMTIQLVQRWASENMPEMLVLFLTAIFIAAVLRMLGAHGHSARRWAVAAGFLLGFLVLAKQMFLIAGVMIGGAWLVWAALRRRRTVGDLVALGLAAAVVILPWFSYNLATNARIDLMTGTAGWHDMPSVYSQEYIDGEYRIEIRERLFEEQAAETGVEISGDVARVIAGREMFMENLKAGDYWSRIPSLIWVKAREAATGKTSDQLIRIVAVLGVMVLLMRPRFVGSRTSENLLVVLCGVALAPLIMVLVMFPDLGRLVLVTWLPVTLLAGVPIALGIREVGTSIEQRAMRASVEVE